MRRRTARSSATITLAVAALLVATSANAVPDVNEANDVAGLIADVTPVATDVQPVTEAADGTYASEGALTLPASAGQAIEVAQTENHPAVSIALPPEAAAAESELADDGTVVYDGATDVAVQVISDSEVQIQTVSESADAPSEYTYGFDGVTPVQREDGSIDLVIQADKLEIVAGTVAAPWAVDANGAAVDTSYRVEGNSLIQVVNADADAAYPIVADPKISIGWGIYISAWGWEIKSLAATASAVAGVSGTAACSFGIAKLPGHWKTTAAVACTTLGWVNLKNMVAFVASQVAQVGHTITNNGCWQMNYSARSPWKSVDNSHCV